MKSFHVDEYASISRRPASYVKAHISSVTVEKSMYKYIYIFELNIFRYRSTNPIDSCIHNENTLAQLAFRGARWVPNFSTFAIKPNVKTITPPFCTLGQKTYFYLELFKTPQVLQWFS